MTRRESLRRRRQRLELICPCGHAILLARVRPADVRRCAKHNRAVLPCPGCGELAELPAEVAVLLGAA